MREAAASRFVFCSPILVLMSVGLVEPEGKPHLDRYVSTIAIAAAIFAAVRLARLSDRDLSIPNVMSTIQQSVRLARTILDEAMRR